MIKAKEIHFMMDRIETDVPDGEYDLYSSLLLWSDTKIKVKDGLVDMNTCAISVIEILEKSGYHGRYVDSIEYDQALASGSFYAFIGS